MKRRDLTKALRKAGLHIEREGGEHTIWQCSCGKHQTSVPRHTEVSAFVVKKIGEQIACKEEGWLQ
jgi:predicted RNA binding protein YcfA (HicA-like mRNA interferase family)